MQSSVMNTYDRLSVSFERGEGAWLWDVEGRKYLDALTGIAVCGLGHAHPRVADAVCRQAQTLAHTSNLYRIPAQERLAQTLTRVSGMERVFFCNSGAEANEAAIKIARMYGHRKGVGLPATIVAEGAFHGRTLATLSATGNRKVQAGFEPLVQGFVRVPFGDLDAIARVAESRRDVVALLVEPIQGENGIVVPDDTYLPGLRAICDENGWLLMLDEVQTGVGRTGRWFAWQHSGVVPDVMTLAKSLGNGVPIGACLAGQRAAEIFQPGSHGSTFGGNPLACSAAAAVLETIQSDDLLDNAARRGEALISGLTDALRGVDHVADIRGRGLMVGVELDRPCRALVAHALDRGLLINVTAERVIRLLPPLIVDEAQVALIVGVLSDLIKSFSSR